MSRKSGKQNTGRRVAIIEDGGILHVLGRLFNAIFFVTEDSLKVGGARNPRIAKQEFDKIVKNAKKGGSKIIYNGKANRG